MVDVNAEGNPVFGPAAGADTFKAEMEKYVKHNPIVEIINIKLEIHFWFRQIH